MLLSILLGIGLLLGIVMWFMPDILVTINPLAVFYNPVTQEFKFTDEHAMVITLVFAALLIINNFMISKRK